MKMRRHRLDGIDINFLFAFQDVRKTNRLPVQEDQVNLGMRHSAGLNHIFLPRSSHQDGARQFYYPLSILEKRRDRREN
jgi:hypothetical protein